MKGISLVHCADLETYRYFNIRLKKGAMTLYRAVAYTPLQGAIIRVGFITQCGGECRMGEPSGSLNLQCDTASVLFKATPSF